jgi:hypothetical protein
MFVCSSLRLWLTKIGTGDGRIEFAQTFKILPGSSYYLRSFASQTFSNAR